MTVNEMIVGITGLCMVGLAFAVFMYALPKLRRFQPWHATGLWILAMGWVVTGVADVVESFAMEHERTMRQVGNGLTAVGILWLLLTLRKHSAAMRKKHYEENT